MRFHTRKRERLISRGWLRLPVEVRQQYRLLNKPHIELRREIEGGLNVIEHWNSVNGFIMYGKGGEFATNRREDQEITMLSLHLLQLCLVYINTLMMQQILSEPQWQNRLQAEDLRALTPLVYGHVTPYGTFLLDMSKRLVIEKAATA
jgi:TnpA family transposase